MKNMENLPHTSREEGISSWLIQYVAEKVPVVFFH